MPLSLRAASALVRRDGNPYEHDERLAAYHRELLAQFDLEPDPELLRRSPNIGFPELAEGVLRGLPVGISSPDLLVLAYGLPDMYPLKSTTSHLNHLLGGGSRSFAISEQGLRAPFTALRVADAYARSGRCTDLALFICDQTTLPYHDPIVHDTPLVDSAVLLYFDQGGGLQFQASWPTGPADGLAELLARATSGLDLTRTLIVAGPWVAPGELDPYAGLVHRVTAGGYCTSVWLELARHHEDWLARFDAVVLCDTDPRTGRGQAALLRHAPVGPASFSADKLMERAAL